MGQFHDMLEPYPLSLIMKEDSLSIRTHTYWSLIICRYWQKDSFSLQRRGLPPYPCKTSCWINHIQCMILVGATLKWMLESTIKQERCLGLKMGKTFQRLFLGECGMNIVNSNHSRKSVHSYPSIPRYIKEILRNESNTSPCLQDMYWAFGDCVSANNSWQ